MKDLKNISLFASFQKYLALHLDYKYSALIGRLTCRLLSGDARFGIASNQSQVTFTNSIIHNAIALFLFDRSSSPSLMRKHLGRPAQLQYVGATSYGSIDIIVNHPFEICLPADSQLSSALSSCLTNLFLCAASTHVIEAKDADKYGISPIFLRRPSTTATAKRWRPRYINSWSCPTDPRYETAGGK